MLMKEDYKFHKEWGLSHSIINNYGFGFQNICNQW